MEKKIFIMDHPLIQHKLTFLRDKNTGTQQFRALVSEIANLMCYEATRDLPLMEVQTETPIQMATTKVIAGRKLAFVPILRAGLGMVEGVLQLVPSAKVGHITKEIRGVLKVTQLNVMAAYRKNNNLKTISQRSVNEVHRERERCTSHHAFFESLILVSKAISQIIRNSRRKNVSRY